ncbi:MAG: hypothetical protein ABGY10_09950 [bacterium]|nr:hypothetical protein [Gemmatimonadota bacterium]HIL90654.1 hypothetical protein [Gemmatimonadota bacterium]
MKIRLYLVMKLFGESLECTTLKANRGSNALILGLMVLSMGACEFLTGVHIPDHVSVEIGSSDVSNVTVVQSYHFLMIPNPECPDDPSCPAVVYLVNSDTSSVALPFERTYPFTERHQFFLETYPPEGEEATLTMRIMIDEKEWYNDFRKLLPAGENGDQETFQFVYQFGETMNN